MATTFICAACRQAEDEASKRNKSKTERKVVWEIWREASASLFLLYPILTLREEDPVAGDSEGFEALHFGAGR